MKNIDASTLTPYSYDSTKYADDPCCDASLLYWWSAMEKVILKTHPQRSLVGEGAISKDDLLMDGYEAVHKALSEFEPDRGWDDNLGAFLTIRVPQRLIDAKRDNRRQRQAGGIFREVTDADPTLTTPEEIISAVNEQGLWPEWLGTLTPERLVTNRQVLQAAFESGHARLDAKDANGDGIGDNIISPTTNDRITDEVAVYQTRHILGLDRELLLVRDGRFVDAPVRLQTLDDYTRLGALASTTENAQAALHTANTFAGSLSGLMGSVGWGDRGKGRLAKVIKACPNCGLIWPMAKSGDCGRAECRWGFKEVPVNFTYDFWAPYEVDAIRRLAIHKWLKDAPHDVTFTQARRLARAAGWKPKESAVTANADLMIALTAMQKRWAWADARAGRAALAGTRGPYQLKEKTPALLLIKHLSLTDGMTVKELALAAGATSGATEGQLVTLVKHGLAARGERTNRGFLWFAAPAKAPVSFRETPAGRLILRNLSPTEGVTVRELTASTGLPKSTISHLLRGMADRGVADRSDTSGLHHKWVVLPAGKAA